MINVRTIRKLQENDGLTLKNGTPMRYRSGWQVATEGVACVTPEQAMKAIRSYGGNCGVWLEKGIYYIDKSYRVNTKAEAMKIGREHFQISILNWRTMGLAYC